MMFDDRQFSRQAKMALMQHLEGVPVDFQKLEDLIDKVQFFDLTTLKDDTQKMSFWINMYNGLTNYLIVVNHLEETVWEKQDFFVDRSLNVGGFFLSLDDIEHGILRRNAERRNEKPRQFRADDPRLKLMVNDMDFRIHFALNCGSISCPPIAYYDVADLDVQLAMAEESFATSEFLVDHEKETIECSSIFLWYRKDFGERYLNDPKLSRYHIVERPYIWKIR